MDNIEKLLSLNYELSIKRLEEDGEIYFAVSYPELPGLVVYTDTIEEGITDIENAKQEWFYAALESNMEIPLPREDKVVSGRITLRLPKSLHYEVKNKAAMEGVSLNLFLNQLINNSLRVYDMQQVSENIVIRASRNMSRIIKRFDFRTEKVINKLTNDIVKKEEYHIHLNIPDNKNNYPLNSNKIDGFAKKQKVIPLKAIPN